MIPYTEETIVKNEIYNGKAIKTIISPTFGGYTAWLGFSLQSIQDTVKKTILSRIILSIGILIIGISFAFLLGIRMTKDIKTLKEAVEEIGNTFESSAEGNISFHPLSVGGSTIWSYLTP